MSKILKSSKERRKDEKVIEDSYDTIDMKIRRRHNVENVAHMSKNL